VVRLTSPAECFRRFDAETDAAEDAAREILAVLSVKTIGSRTTAQRILRTAEACLRRFNAAGARADEALRDLFATLGVGPVAICGVAPRRVSPVSRRHPHRRRKERSIQRRPGRPNAPNPRPSPLNGCSLNEY
jgi:hypothetical protein